MKKSIFLFFAAILCAIGMNAATVTSDGTARLYFNMKAVSWWNTASSNGGNFCYFYNNSTGKNAWSAKAVQYSGDTYYVVIPKGDWAGAILTRNSVTSNPSWNNKWNQTGDITLSNTGNYISKFSEGSTSVTWGTQKPTSNASVSSSSSSVFVGAPANLTAALTSNANINTVKSVTYSTTTGASISGSTFTATAEGTYTVTATVTYHPNGYPSITSTATATTDITVTVPAEEVHDVTVSYMCGTTSVATAIAEFVGVESEKSFTAPTVSGYKFTNWTIGAGIDLKAGTASDATITVVTKSASSDYTLVANYEEVIETVYFINTNKWARVNIHKWDGKAADSSWPGEKLTASGEKIGEYDVYSYTAKQGDYANIIFNSKTSSTDGGNAQTADLTWTAGKYYIYNYGGKSDWYTKEDAEALLVVPVVTHDIVVKAVAPEVWNSGTISIHYWGDGISAPSKPVATEKDGNWNKYTIKNVPEGTSVSVIFINGADWSNHANQTADITGITEDKCFQISAAKLDSDGKCTVKEVDCDATIEPEVDVYTMMGAGELGLSWDLTTTGNDMTKQTDGTYTLVKEGLDLATTGSYEYKVVKNHSWDWSIPSGNANQTLKVDKDGTYTVTFTLSADKKKLTADAVRNTRTVAATAENGTVTGAGEYAHGTEVTLTATANDHYVFVNWTKGEEVVAKTAEYTFTVEEDVELKANFARDTHTLTATAENGTVTGAGTYNHGATVTLTATPDFDYEFVKWSNESTDNPLTITVTDNETLEAIFAEVAATEKKESGVFSISAHKTATFATGNLQYNVGTQAWRFAKQQYQVVGEQNIQLGHPDFTGWIDMFGYSADGKFGVNPSNANADYAKEFVDWGTLFPEEGWSTLSKEDWKYLLEERTNAANLQQVAEVDTMLGILLFPDAWVMPEGVTPTEEKVEYEKEEYQICNFTYMHYTLEQWAKLEEAGAVFLPAAGRRTGGWGNETLSENVPGGVLDADGHYKHFDNCNEYAYYWTSTKVGEDVNYLINCCLVDKPNNIYSVGAAHVDWAEKGRYGQSVRLAKVVYDKHTVTAIAENGTVTGAGEYTHGTEVTLTATPAFDYEFEKWSNGATENPLTITVTDNVTLEANFKEVTATEKKESGKFSISAHKTATFATGNLQHNVGTGEWRFAKQQYQVVGEQNINLGDPDFKDWIDMFGYSADGKYGVNPSNSNADYTKQFVDWGTLFPGEGWSTLSKEDWKYLLETRTNAANLQQVAEVDTMLGILLFPDAWVMPEGVTPTEEKVEYEKEEYQICNFTYMHYTLEQWAKLEEAGAVFLPAAGRRTGGWGNETLSENVPGGVLDADGHYKHFDNCNEYAYYWTSTKVGEDVNYLINCCLVDKPNNIYSVGAAHVDWAEKGRYGQSVRLAKVVYDKHTVTVTAENGTVTGAGEYTHGDTVTLTATPAEHYVFVNWTAGETVLSTENPYIFTLEKDVELTANFALDTHTVTATAENGTVTGAGEYTHGTEVTLTATPTEGYEFVNWTAGKDTVSTEATYTFRVEADVNLVANFQEVVPVITHTVKWYTAVGETTEVTLEDGATITKPATDPEMEGHVFMGWTNECFVAEDGSDFAAIEDFGTAYADKEYYAVFAVETTTDGGVTETLTGSSLSYAGNSGYVEFTATTTSGTWSGKACYNTNDYIQINKNKNNYHIGSPTFAANIKSIKITTTNSTASSRKFYICSSNSTAQPSSGDLGNHTTTASNEQFTIELTSDVKQFYIYSSGAVYISQIDVTLSGEPTTTYSSYMTTCTPEEYTIEWSVNGKVTETTTVVEGDALVLPEAPEAPEACLDKVFMGWATTATVNADGSAITWVADTIIPKSDKIYYAVFATKTVDEENSEAGSVTLAYAGGTTTNMTVDGNNAATVGLNAEEWSVTAAKGGNNNAPGLNTAGDIRLYYSADGSNTITVSSLVENVTISNITITYTEDKYSNSKVLVNDAVVAGTDGTYTINANSFVITNGNTSNVQVRIKSIVINYTKPSITYTDYSTICVIPEYTVTFYYSVDAGYITVNDDRISEKEVTYAEGTVLTVKALTFNDYRFDAWIDEEGNELVTTPEYTFTVTADVVLEAVITYIPGAVGTGVENNNVVMSETIKVIQNGRLFIIREGKIYNAQGQVVK